MSSAILFSLAFFAVTFSLQDGLKRLAASKDSADNRGGLAGQLAAISTDSIAMRKVLLLVILGLVSYAAYFIWNDPEGSRARLSRLSGVEDEPKPGVPEPTKGVPDPVPEVVAFARQNMEAILAPLMDQALEVNPGPLYLMKTRLAAESAKPCAPARKNRLQAAIQLSVVMVQAIAQRAEYARKRQASEFRGVPPPDSKTRVSPSEIAGKMKQAEFFIRSTEKKWNDLAAQHRAAIIRLLTAVSA